MARLLKLQFTSFRGATFEIAVCLFSRRDFRYCSLLAFEAQLSKVQFTRFRGTTFDIAVYSFPPPPPSQSTKSIQKCSPCYFQNYSLLVFLALLSKMQFTSFRDATFDIQFGRFRGATFEITFD